MQIHPLLQLIAMKGANRMESTSPILFFGDRRFFKPQ
jgi:hypothetical protein